MKVSCIIATNRDDGFLSKTIESVLNQTFYDFELIIVANNCPDTILNLLESFKDNRMKILRSDLEDIAYARNLGIDNAKGEYIAIVDSDDICETNRFQIQVNYMESNSHIKVLSTWAKTIDSEGIEKGKLEPLLPINLDWLCVFNNPIINPSVMFTKSIWKKYKGYTGIPSSEDVAFWLKIVSDGEKGFAILPKYLISYRIHGNQTYRKKGPYIEAACFQFKLFLSGKGSKYFLGAIFNLIKMLLRGK